MTTIPLATPVDCSHAMRSKSRPHTGNSWSSTRASIPDTVPTTSLAHPELLKSLNVYLNSSLNSSVNPYFCLSKCSSSISSTAFIPSQYLSEIPSESQTLNDSETIFHRNQMAKDEFGRESLIPNQFTLQQTGRLGNKLSISKSGATPPDQCRSSELGVAPPNSCCSPQQGTILLDLCHTIQPGAIPPDMCHSPKPGEIPPEPRCSPDPPLGSFRHSPLKSSSSTWWWAGGDLNTPENSGGSDGGTSHTRLATPTPTLPAQRLISCRRGGRRTMDVVALERRSRVVGEAFGGRGVGGGAEGCGGRGGRGVGGGGGGCWGGAKVAEWWRRQEGEGRRRKRKTGWLSFSLWLTLALSLAVASPSSAALDNEIHSGKGSKSEPEFGDPIDNVTVAAGREARLSCVVDNLGNFRVGWLKVDSQTILSLQKRVVTHNTRISVTHDEHRTWNLHIRQVKETDRGCYMCQINTPVMKNRVGCIEVHVPPDIIYSLTSSDTTINEGDLVNLSCVAEGYPTPEIKWKREDGRPIVVRSSNSPKALDWVTGGNLTLENVSRTQMGAYLCIATNKVPPSVSKRIIVNVNFSPVVKVDNQLIGAPLGTDVEIECKVEAFPKAVNYWERENGEMMLNNRKYHLREEMDSYRVIMKLVIRNFTQDDEGKYKCISTNSLGKADTGIRIYVIDVPTVKVTTEHTYHPHPTTPHSKSVNSLDLLRREGQSKLREGLPGIDGATVALGMDFPEKEQNRQRQRQRLDYAGEGRASNGVLGGPFQNGEGESQGGGSSTARSSISTLWIGLLLLRLVGSLTSLRVNLKQGGMFL